MRDDQGELLPNAHLIGFFRRICKLLFHNIRPIFIFDGDTPTLKRRTVAERRRRREQQEVRLRKTAEKLLLNKLKRHILATNVVTSSPTQQAPADGEGSIPTIGNIDEAGTITKNSGAKEGPVKEDRNFLESTDGTHEEAVQALVAPQHEPRAQESDSDSEDLVFEPLLPEVGIVSHFPIAVLNDTNAVILIYQACTLQGDGAVDPIVLSTLPPSVQLDVMLRLRDRQMAANRGEFEQLSGKPEKFSEYQMQQYLKASNLRRQLDVLRGAGDLGGASARPIAAEEGKEYVLEKEEASGPAQVADPQDEIRIGHAESRSALVDLTFEVEIGHTESDEDLDWEDVDEGAKNLKGPRQSFARRQYWSLSHGFQMGRQLGNWGEKEKPGKAITVEGAAGAPQDIAWEDDDDDLQLQEAVRKSLEEDPLEDASAGIHVAEVSRTAVGGSVDKGVGAAVVKQTEQLHNQSPALLEVLENKVASAKRPMPLEKRIIDAPKSVSSGKNAPPPQLLDHKDGSRTYEETRWEALLQSDAEVRDPKSVMDMIAAPPESLGKPEEPARGINIAGQETSEAQRSVDLPDLEAEVSSDGDVVFEDVEVLEEEPVTREPVGDTVKDQTAAEKGADARIQGPSGAAHPDEPLDIVPVNVPATALNGGKGIDSLGVALQQRNRQEEVVEDLVLMEAYESTEAPLSLNLDDLREEETVLRAQQRAAAGNAATPTDVMYTECQELLQLFGLPYIIAPMEAEAQAAWLDAANMVDGVITDDNDAFLFGARRVYRNLFESSKYVEEYRAEDIERELGLSRERLVMLAMLLGSDYTPGVAGVGVVNAVEVVHAFGDAEGLSRFGAWVKAVDEQIIELARAAGGIEDVQGKSAGASWEGPEQEFMTSHRNIRKSWSLPSDFPSMEVMTAYIAPKVDDSKEKFIFDRPDALLLRNFCDERFGWDGSRVDDLLVPVLKAYDERTTQQTLDNFVAYRQRFAKIRSQRLRRAVAGIAGGDVEGLVLPEAETKPAAKQQRGKRASEEVANSEVVEISNSGVEALQNNKKRVRRSRKSQILKE